ncbi:hypothetical protein JCM8097_007339 [Rhodosporidiobolus ruineniae]
MAYRSTVLDLTLSSDEDDAAPAASSSRSSRVEGSLSSTKRRLPPRIVDSDDDEDALPVPQYTRQPAQQPRKATARIVDSDDEEDFEVEAIEPARRASIDALFEGTDDEEEEEPDTEPEGEGEDLGGADTSREEGGKDDAYEHDSFLVEDDDDEQGDDDEGDGSFRTASYGQDSDYKETPSPARPPPQEHPLPRLAPAPAAKPAAKPNKPLMTDEEQYRQYGFVIQPSKPSSAAPSRQFGSSLSNSSNTSSRHSSPPSSLFVPTARKVSGGTGLASSSSAFNVPASAATKQLSTKQMLQQQMEQARKKLGVPIDVPKNAPLSYGMASAEQGMAGLDDDRVLDKVLANLNIDTNQGQEAALKELVSSTVDMEGVDTTETDPDGLKCTLLPHQLQGLHWLKDRESKKKRGGILGDDMGLGKTVQMLALMLANPRRKEDRDKIPSKTTLIVCPLGLMSQWKKEIEDKSDGRLRCLIHHGSSRTKDARKLQKYEVVITSYDTCSSEWLDPKGKKTGAKGKGKGKAARSDSDDDEADDINSMLRSSGKGSAGALFDEDYSFYRVILDEAHEIKNRTTKKHKACCALSSRYRWCLTGTPIQNTVMDLYAQFEFLGRIVNPLHEYSEFKAKIADPLKNEKRQKLAFARLSVVLKAIMLRRKKTDMVDGRPLLKLPKREIIEVKTPFLDPDEAEFYKAIEDKMQLQMNKFIKAGTVMENYIQVLLKLLRMRQACNHPGLITGDREADNEALEVVPDRASPNVSRSPSKSDDLSSLLGGLSLAAAVPKEEDEGATCALCPTRVDSEKTTYCASCAEELNKYPKLMLSTKVRRLLKILEDIKKESAEERRRVKEANRRKEEEAESDEEYELEEYRPKKTIIFSQFTTMFDILEPFLKEGGYRYARFDGKLNAKQNAQAIDQIRDDPKCTVILVSLKCGAVGLNLTCCSRVILCDLWWNPAIEQQAFDRAHRFGQKDDVKIFKLTIADTVEDRIATLQEKKAGLAQAALEGNADIAKGNKLNLNELMFLFRGDDADAKKSRRNRLEDDE